MTWGSNFGWRVGDLFKMMTHYQRFGPLGAGSAAWDNRSRLDKYFRP
jgi:hypothetical protein